MATGTSSVLTIENRQDPAYDGIDDIVLTDEGNLSATPEPAGLVLLGTGLVGIARFTRSRRKRS